MAWRQTLYSFSEVYPGLFRIVRRKDDTVAEVLRATPLNVSFRRGLVNLNRIAWFGLVSKVVNVHLTMGEMFSDGTFERKVCSQSAPCIEI